MALRKAAACASYSEAVCVETVIEVLNHAGFESKKICVMFSPRHPIATAVKGARLAADLDTAADATSLVEWLAQLGAVVIPGVGLFLHSSDYLQTLMAAEAGNERVGPSALLCSLGLTKASAERCQQDLLQEGALVFVRCDEVAESEWAREILFQTGADEAFCVGDDWEELAMASGE
jgi:hypothetical protein